MAKKQIESKCGSCVHLEACKAWIRHGYTLYNDFSYSVDDCPHYVSAADVVEVKHGQWVDRYGGKYDNPKYECSECRKEAPYRPKLDDSFNWYHEQDLSDYCPNCGADMRERRENNA